MTQTTKTINFLRKLNTSNIFGYIKRTLLTKRKKKLPFKIDKNIKAHSDVNDVKIHLYRYMHPSPPK